MIPFIPTGLPAFTAATGPDPEPDPDGYPKRSTCAHCTEVIEQEGPGADWTIGNLFGGRSSECPQAPNPDGGPMPGHTPGTAILSPPKR